jgi:5-methyltetrahydrofolate--homocysteine methyltransferase
MTTEVQRERFIQNVNEALVDWDKERLVSLVNEGLETSFTPVEITGEVLLPVLQKACKEIDTYDISFAELLLLADTIKAALDILIPKIKASLTGTESRGRIVIGTVKGDIHELGKNLVAAILQSGGYQVTDLGTDVSIADFVRAIEEEKADVLAVSSLMTPTIVSMEHLLKEIRSRNLKIKTIIGGLATSPGFARRAGADAWAEDAMDGLRKVNKLMLGSGHA